MFDALATTICSACKAPFDTSKDTPEKRAACPCCGSTKRHHDLSIQAKAGAARVGMKIKAKGLGQKKPHVELKQGPSDSYELGKPVERVYLIDRGNDWYSETVSDYESGELIYHNAEPLSAHIEHGTAKKKNDS